MYEEIKMALSDWFKRPGAYVLVDGQYGSTGKGLVAGLLAECFKDDVICVISNQGPNSGHTSYYGDEKIVLKQLPTFSVIAHKIGGYTPATYFSAGAVIDGDILEKEKEKHKITGVIIDPNAAIVLPCDKEADKTTVDNIASTGQGVGPALIRKIMRVPDGTWGHINFKPYIMERLSAVCFFMEIPQGFSLGINSGFYPHTTARECSVSQALADAHLPPSLHRKTIMVCRTYPIRVGNTQGSSGPCYPDQIEISFGMLGKEPELTTVTGRVRRIFTWSDLQYADSLFTLDPNVVVLTFCDYLNPAALQGFVKEKVYDPYLRILRRKPEAILLSFGPRSTDIEVWRP